MKEDMIMKECYLTKNGPKAIGPYSTAVRVGNTIYMSGMLGLVPEKGALAEGGIEAQAAQALNNVRTVLEEMGLSMDSVVKTTVFMQDIGDFGKVNAIYATYFNGNYPSRSCVQVARLPMNALIEVEAIAIAE